MQTREKNNQLSIVWAPESFWFTNENCLLLIKIAKILFKVIACKNCAKQLRLLQFSLMQKIEKNQHKTFFLQLWGASEAYEIFD